MPPALLRRDRSSVSQGSSGSILPPLEDVLPRVKGLTGFDVAAPHEPCLLAMRISFLGAPVNE